jgi:AcrR family transcriptional regulator
LQMTTAPEGTRRSRRKERTRHALLEAGRKLIGESGVAGLRIQEVTELADIGLGSFYSYFVGKEDFVQAVVSDSLETLATTLAQDQTGNDPALITAEGAYRSIRLAFEQPEFAQLLVSLDHSDEVFSEAMNPQARRVVARGIAEGRFDVPDIDVAVNYIVAGSLALIRRALRGDTKRGAERAHAELALRTLGLDPAEAKAVARTAEKQIKKSSAERPATA